MSRRPSGSRRSLKPGDKLGYDPHLHTPDAVARFTAACEKAGAGLVAVDSNPIDAIWLDRPPAPLGPISPHPMRFAGEGAREENRPGAAKPSGRRMAS